jgi:hypothetical protein
LAKEGCAAYSNSFKEWIALTPAIAIPKLRRDVMLYESAV